MGLCKTPSECAECLCCYWIHPSAQRWSPSMMVATSQCVSFAGTVAFFFFFTRVLEYWGNSFCPAVVSFWNFHAVYRKMTDSIVRKLLKVLHFNEGTINKMSIWRSLDAFMHQCLKMWLYHDISLTEAIVLWNKYYSVWCIWKIFIGAIISVCWYWPLLSLL